MRRSTASTERTQPRSDILAGYHSGARFSSHNYAFLGFNKNLYFTSDRTKELDADFNTLDGSTLKGYGLEIELESMAICNDTALAYTLNELAFSKLPKNLFKYQTDGSLSGGRSSCEAITQVMTREFIRNNYPGFYNMYQVFKIFQISASRSGNCGMHCNLSVALFGKDKASQETAIKKLIYFVNKHFDLACVLLKRDPSRTGFCGKMYSWADQAYAKSFDLSMTSEDSSNHHVCFNYAHYNTGRVELRLVGGQPDYYAFRNTMETIFHLVGAVKSLSWTALDDVKAVFKGCNKYVVKRLEDAVGKGVMTSSELEEIRASSDTETDFGNF